MSKPTTLARMSARGLSRFRPGTVPIFVPAKMGLSPLGSPLLPLLPPRPNPPDGRQEKRAGAAGRIEQPLPRIAGVAHLIEHVFREPVGRVVLAQFVPQRPRQQLLVEVAEQVAAVAAGREQCVVALRHAGGYFAANRAQLRALPRQMPGEEVVFRRGGPPDIALRHPAIDQRRSEDCIIGMQGEEQRLRRPVERSAGPRTDGVGHFGGRPVEVSATRPAEERRPLFHRGVCGRMAGRDRLAKGHDRTARKFAGGNATNERSGTWQIHAGRLSPDGVALTSTLARRRWHPSTGMTQMTCGVQETTPHLSIVPRCGSYRGKRYSLLGLAAPHTNAARALVHTSQIN